MLNGRLTACFSTKRLNYTLTVDPVMFHQSPLIYKILPLSNSRILRTLLRTNAVSKRKRTP